MKNAAFRDGPGSAEQREGALHRARDTMPTVSAGSAG
jgi:hypothetical protein